LADTAHVNSTQGGPLPLHTIKDNIYQVNISSFLSEFFFLIFFCRHCLNYPMPLIPSRDR
jgi:hypothetical protein